MRRTLVLPLLLVALVGAMSIPADAHHKDKHTQGPKAKPRPVAQPVVVRGSYEVQLRPDPCARTTGAVWWGCFAATNGDVGGVPDERDLRDLRFSGPGTFRATLRPEHTIQDVLTEWALQLRSGAGAWQRARAHDGSYDLTYVTAQAATLRLWAQNRNGWPNATVTWSFTYR